MKSLAARVGALIGFAIALLPIASGIGLLFFTDSFMKIVATLVLPLISFLAAPAIGASLMLGIPFMFFRKTSDWAGVIFQLTALLVGFGIAFWSLLLVYALWGKFWTLVALVFLPFLPLTAAVAHGLAGNWSVVGGLALNVFVWFLLIAGATFADSRR